MTTEPTRDESRPVRDEDAFDVEALAAWLGRGPISGVRQFPGGASNLTYLLQMAEGDDLILRRPPTGTKAKGAHDMGREYRLQEALGEVFAKVAPMVAYATEDESPIGAELYVMGKVPGVIPRMDFGFPVTPEQADALCRNAVDTLADLHALDVTQVPGLARLAKGDGYIERQMSGWCRRFEAVITEDTGDWSDVIDWLRAHQPDDVAQVLIHNDYRFDNMVLDAEDPTRIVALLDWELATVGDPLMELGNTMTYWVQADDDELFQAFRRQPTNAPGMWTRAQVTEHYLARTGYAPSAQDLAFYEVFGQFRLAVIAQQIWYRYVHKQTTNEAHAVLGQAVAYMEQRSRALIRGTEIAS